MAWEFDVWHGSEARLDRNANQGMQTKSTQIGMQWQVVDESGTSHVKEMRRKNRKNGETPGEVPGWRTAGQGIPLSSNSPLNLKLLSDPT